MSKLKHAQGMAVLILPGVPVRMKMAQSSRPQAHRKGVPGRRKAHEKGHRHEQRRDLQETHIVRVGYPRNGQLFV